MNNMLRKELWEVLRPLLQLVTNMLNPDIGEEWTRELKRFLRREPCWAGHLQVFKRFLEPYGKALVHFERPLSKERVDAFFYSRAEVSFGGNAKALLTRVLSAEPSVELPSTIELLEYRLVRDTNDSTIRSELPENHVFGKNELRAILVSVITAQLGGAKGVFRNDGRIIKFFMTSEQGVITIEVSFALMGDSRRWQVNAWHLNSSNGGAPLSVFSRN